QGRPHLDIKIEDYKLCPRYEGVVIEGIEIAPSPNWMQKRISVVGMRSINNIVDITNYVMWELGQPLHAFDYDKLDGHKIIVRTAKNGEAIETLDDEKRKLDDSILVIADAKKPVAIAGVMGGANTEIDNQTKKIIIESANFDHVSIRKTEVKLGLRSEASIRFEKSLDPNLTDLAIKRAVELIFQVCPKAKLATRIEDVKKFKLNQGPINVSFDFLNKRIGEQIAPNKIIDILESLGFEVKKQKEGLEILVPSWRATKDISIPEDIIEEVARIYGYDNLTISMPMIAMDRPQVNYERELEKKIKSILSLGFAASEVYNYSFVGEEQVKKMGLRVEDHVRISNPQAKEWNLLRRSLIPNLLESARLNARFYDDFSLFESGLTYIPEYEGEITSDKEANFLPLQDKWLGCLVTEKKNDKPFYIAKNILAGLLSRLHFDYRLGQMTEFIPLVKENRAVDIIVADREIGYITELPDELYEKLGLKNKVAYFELNISKLAEFYTDEIEYKSIPKFPSIDLDVSMIIAKNVLWEEIASAVREVEKDLIREVTFFDVYEGAGIPEGKKSIAFRIIYRSDDKTLTMEEVQVIHQKVLQILVKLFDAQIRK
ncbi:MAG: phenylalanine--tRNA ligase subunit beta, partial [Patescibacteria group bacterium]|nr:phenylalanine--tRNA ligase subunit beta [Patescibacteria group bacterium]